MKKYVFTNLLILATLGVFSANAAPAPKAEPIRAEKPGEKIDPKKPEEKVGGVDSKGAAGVAKTGKLSSLIKELNENTVLHERNFTETQLKSIVSTYGKMGDYVLGLIRYTNATIKKQVSEGKEIPSHVLTISDTFLKFIKDRPVLDNNDAKATEAITKLYQIIGKDLVSGKYNAEETAAYNQLLIEVMARAKSKSIGLDTALKEVLVEKGKLDDFMNCVFAK